MATIILGTGIIGVATAHYLSQYDEHGTIHLVDNADELFSSASGFAGGFLAKDWFSGPMLRLASLSFDLHRSLAAEHGGTERWGYGTGTAFSYVPAPDAANPAETRSGNWLLQGFSRAEQAANSEEPSMVEKQAPPVWLRRQVGDSLDCLSVDTVAQVDPAALCRFLLEQCVARGVKLHHPAAAVSVQTDKKGKLAGLRIRDIKTAAETAIPCARVVVAAGVWSPSVFATLFPKSPVRLPISSLAGHSLLVRTNLWRGHSAADGQSQARLHALYSSRMDGFAPELFSWANGTVYLAGLNDAGMTLPATASEVKRLVSPDAVERLKDTARKMVAVGEGEGEGEVQVVRQALCFRPVTDIGTPIISQVPDELLGEGLESGKGKDGGVFVVAGHGPWGINLSLGTGRVAAEMMLGRECSIGDLDYFAISRFI